MNFSSPTDVVMLGGFVLPFQYSLLNLKREKGSKNREEKIQKGAFRGVD